MNANQAEKFGPWRYEQTHRAFLDIVRGVFTDCSENEAEYILWNETGYPGFWNSADGQSPLECCHTQVVRYRAGLFFQEAAA